MSDRPTILMYCQHVLGIGHFVRSTAIAAGLQRWAQVVILLGGELPEVLDLPSRVESVRLVPIGKGESGQMQSFDPNYSLSEALAKRQEQMQQAVEQYQPDAISIEHFPFGRETLVIEILPFLEAARERIQPAPLVLSSLRDVLKPKQNHDRVVTTFACVVANAYFDAVLVHSDPTLIQLPETFKPAIPLKIPVHYTGFVIPEPKTPTETEPAIAPPYLLVSAGGGRLGGNLFRAAIAAYARLSPDPPFKLLILAGIFLPEPEWEALQAQAQQVPGVELRRWASDLYRLLCGARASISMCGYNTTLDLLRSRVPALLIPSDEDTDGEQHYRAQRLESLGAVMRLSASQLDAETLASAMEKLLVFEPQIPPLDFQGVENTSRWLEASLVQRQRSRF